MTVKVIERDISTERRTEKGKREKREITHQEMETHRLIVRQIDSETGRD
jgi:hypothetical protein